MKLKIYKDIIQLIYEKVIIHQKLEPQKKYLKMKTNNKEKDFDCVKMKNDIQKKIYEKIKDLTFKEQREYIQKMLNSNISKI